MTNRSWIALATLLTTFWFGFSARAEIVETCTLSGEIQLTQDRQILCTQGDLKIAAGTHIVTNGYPLTIVVNGNIYYPKQGLKIEAPMAEDDLAGQIEIDAHTAFGVLDIQTGGQVHLIYMGTNGRYRQHVLQPAGADLQVEING